MENYYDENDSDQETSTKNNHDHSGDNEDLSTDIVKKMNEEYRKNNENNFPLIEMRSENGLDECICDIHINCPYCIAQQRKVVTQSILKKRMKGLRKKKRKNIKAC